MTSCSNLHFLDKNWTPSSPEIGKVSETEDYKVTTGTNEQACCQKLYNYILQNISIPTIPLITYLFKTTLHILKQCLLVTYLQWNKAHTYTPYISHTKLQHTHLDKTNGTLEIKYKQTDKQRHKWETILKWYIQNIHKYTKTSTNLLITYLHCLTYNYRI